MKSPLNKMTASFALVALASGLTGCGQGFTSASTLASNSSNSSSGAGNITVPSTEADAAFKALEVDGTAGGIFGNGQLISIDKVNKELIVRLPAVMGLMNGINFGGGEFAQLPGAQMLMENSGAGSFLTLRVPLKFVVKGVNFVEPTRLPNGDPLPAFPDGEAPSLGLGLGKNQKATVYLSPSALGLFVTSSFDPKLKLTLPIRNKARTRTWGYISTVPAKLPYQGGFFISIVLPDDIARMLDEVL